MQQSTEEILSLLKEIEEIIQTSKTPLTASGKKLVDAEEIYAILDEIVERFPAEIADARRIIKEHNEILNGARVQAEQIIMDAQQQAMIIAGDQEVVRLAQQQADDIRNQAAMYERDTRYNAEEYAGSVLKHLEDNLKSITGQVQRVRETLAENSGSTSQNVNW